MDSPPAQDYWAAAVIPLPPPAPSRRPLVLALVLALLVVAAAGALAVRRVQAAAVGEVFAVVWPLGHAKTLSAPATFGSVG